MRWLGDLERTLARRATDLRQRGCSESHSVAFTVQLAVFQDGAVVDEAVLDAARLLRARTRVYRASPRSAPHRPPIQSLALIAASYSRVGCRVGERG